MSTVNIVQDVRLVSNTKDSIHILWNVDHSFSPHIQGYEIEYQAEGSSIVQRQKGLDPAQTQYELINLHENTYYRFCINVLTNLTSEVEQKCIRASTSVDSLHVALGSTFGAFLALGIIVMFVFLAKWQHNRKLRKYALQHVPTNGETYDSMGQPDGEIEMSDVSLHVHDGTTATQMDVSSQSSNFSGKSGDRRKSSNQLENGDIATSEALTQDSGIDEAVSEGAVGGSDIAGAEGGATGDSPDVKVDMNTRSSSVETPPPPPIDPPPPSLKKRASRELLKESLSSNGTSQGQTPSPTISPPPDSNSDPSPPPNSNQKKDYGGARPKEFSSLDPRSAFSNQGYIEIPQPDPVSLRPNLSW